MRLADPWWLVLLPALGFVLWLKSRPGRRPSVLYSSLLGLGELPVTLALRVKRLLPGLEVGGVVLLILAMARPQSGRVEKVVAGSGVAIQMVVDRSRSMRLQDLDPDPFDRKPVSRLDVVKAVAQDFVDTKGKLPGRPDDMVGLVSFAGFVDVNCPLTLDHEAFLRLVEGLHLVPADADQEAQMTAIGDALVTAVNRLKEIKVKSRVAVLLSDGGSNIGEASPKAGAEMAKSLGIRVYTVGIGRPGRGLDEAALQEVAGITGGRYFNARDADGLRRIYQEIDRLERVDLPPLRVEHWQELCLPLLLAGLALLMAHRILGDTRFRSLP